ncbi:spore maturation protein [Pontibacillus litoralis]|uniref:Spore maturation protein n=1 Tax=Pontibacillus litoralis JSM 072002 TaxID=1385512 RepID=A0A0A5G4E6_9BACI|nr:spore maturation protein [Pontibacillus litoralis]KGX85960.1 spore maturation protein [Pontibacillus litoralis JSM 072002]
MPIIATVSVWIIPCIILVVFIVGTWKRVPTYETFVEGGKEGGKMAFSLLPFLLGMMVSIAIFRASGAMDAFVEFFSPILTLVGIPADIVPLALVRPISGTAAIGMTTELIASHGPDSFIGRLASTMQGSTDTTLYIITVYFGAVGIKRMGDALKVGLLADFIGIIASIVVVSIVFGS